MIRLARSASLLVTFYLLTSAATAHAECAWVLWEETFSSAASPRAWTIDAAFGTEAVCEQNMTEIMTRFVEKTKGEKTSYKFRSATTLETVGPLGGHFIRFVCLPDTVDPRGPKGK
jgi:hypothetical protein